MKMRSALILTRAITRGSSHNAQKMKKSFMENVIFLCRFFMDFDSLSPELRRISSLKKC